MNRAWWLSLLVALAGFACNPGDDTTLTVKVQSRVNQVVGPDSDVAVSMRGGVATLSGLAASDAAHLRAVNAAKSMPGVRDVRDSIATPPHTTGAAVPASSGAVAPLLPPR